MDLRIGGFYQQVLLRLAKRNHEPTATGMVRILIRKAALESGLWSSSDFEEESIDPGDQCAFNFADEDSKQEKASAKAKVSVN